MTIDKEQCIEQKVEAVMLKKWHLIVSVISLTVPAVLMFADINNNINLIKQQNVYIAESVKKSDEKNDKQDNLISETKNKVTEICAILKISTK